jgi:hypothetical protein
MTHQSCKTIKAAIVLLCCKLFGIIIKSYYSRASENNRKSHFVECLKGK